MVCEILQLCEMEGISLPSKIIFPSIHHLHTLVSMKKKLVCIETGMVAPASANAECAVEVGERVAARLTGFNFADAKLKRNDKVTSIGAATNSASIRGHDVEIDPTLLFMRVTCTINKSSDMENHLKYEFSKEPPSLFF